MADESLSGVINPTSVGINHRRRGSQHQTLTATKSQEYGSEITSKVTPDGTGMHKAVEGTKL